MSKKRGSVYTGNVGNVGDLFNPKDIPQPAFMVVQEGVFTLDGKVYDFDEEGNWYDLPEEEQEKRRQALKERLWPLPDRRAGKEPSTEYRRGFIG